MCSTQQQQQIPSYVKRPQPANARIQSVTSFLMLWLSVATSGLAWANMPRPLRIKLIITLICLVKQLSKLSSPTTSSSTMRGSILSINWTKIPFNKPVLSRLLGIYKKTTRTANQLPSRQRVIDPKYAPCSAWGNWAISQGGYVDAVEDYWPQPGRSLMQAHPYLSWLSNIKALKLVKAVADLEKWFWWVHRICKHDTREHGVPEVQPTWHADFRWRTCKSIFRTLHPFSQNIRRK